MPKLNTTVENLEFRSNKVIGTPSADWTDEQYPSAKTLYNAVTPAVGGVVITSENVNPSTIYGGAWTLLDKTFASKSFTKVTWTPQNNTDSSGSTVILDGHTIHASVSLITKIVIATSAVLGTVSFSEYTTDTLPHKLYGTTQATLSSNTYLIDYEIDSNGKITVLRTRKPDYTATSLPAGISFYVDIKLTSRYDKIKDANCDKFYWKRVADTN